MNSIPSYIHESTQFSSRHAGTSLPAKVCSAVLCPFRSPLRLGPHLDGPAVRPARLTFSAYVAYSYLGGPWTSGGFNRSGGSIASTRRQASWHYLAFTFTHSVQNGESWSITRLPRSRRKPASRTASATLYPRVEKVDSVSHG